MAVWLTFEASGAAEVVYPSDMEQFPVPQSRSPSMISLLAMGLVALAVVAGASAVGHLLAKEISVLVQEFSEDSAEPALELGGAPTAPQTEVE